MSALAVGLMSGTSLDGIDAALVRLTGDRPEVELLAFRTEPYTEDERDRLEAVLAPGDVRSAALLHADLGRRFTAAAARLLDDAGVSATDVAFVASHGQTVWHEPGRVSLQLGDPAVIAEQLGVPVISDFRSRDIAAGGQGAPLVPLADVLVFGADDHDRLLLNLGGIANLTYAPASRALDRVVAFDTGPGVVLIDAIARANDPTRDFDRDGARAARGTVRDDVVEGFLCDPYFSEPPPKSTGRERFGSARAAELLAHFEGLPAAVEDALATAVACTARAVADQVQRWVPMREGEIVVSGGGARNPVLWRALEGALPAFRLVRFEELFFDGDAKEAVAFAVLGWCTLRGRPGNVPAATGSCGPRVLGRITPA